MKPVPFKLEFDTIANRTGWEEKEITLYFQRTMRRYHDSMLKAFGKSSFLASPDWTRVNVPNGGKVVRQLIRWVYGVRPPDRFGFKDSLLPGGTKYRDPQSEAVPF